MALKGNLRDFNITQLLNLVNLAHKTGTLIIDGPSESVQFAFREGKLAYAQFGQEDNSLAAVLRRNKKINQNQFQILKTRAAQISDKELGLILINAGYVTQEDVINCLQQYATGVVRRLYTWAEGFFHFENEQLTPDHKIAVRIDLENLIIEGTRQMKEWEQLQEEIPSLEMALKFSERPGANLRKVNLSVEEWRVVSFVNPKNSIRQIARATRLNDLDIRRVIYGLLQAGLVEIVRPTSAAPSVAARSLPGAGKVAQKSLVNRLIARIRSI